MDKITVLDAGGQYCHLIARRIRELQVYSEIKPLGVYPREIANTKGIIISGGPGSVYEKHSPKPDKGLFDLGMPILGICYGHQLIAHELGGEVKPGSASEYGIAQLRVLSKDRILAGLRDRETVWMSHGDLVAALPPGFEILASTRDCPVAAMGDSSRDIYGLQFHPEVSHTPSGMQMLKSFVFALCGCEPNWRPVDQIQDILSQISTKVGNRRVFFLVSGGVDSTVAFVLCTRALDKEQVRGLYVDTGLMRKNETREVKETFRRLGLDSLEVLHAEREFLRVLQHAYHPEGKRRAIGSEFLRVQDRALATLGLPGEWLLGQGTIYPDTIESGSGAGSAVIKTHHNRVSRLQKLVEEGKVVEPLAQFYKDEVREIGRRLGLPDEVVNKHPFPGPGLAVRCLCVRQSPGAATRIEGVEDICKDYGIEAAMLPVKTVGIQGDRRTYANLAVVSTTAACDGRRLSEISTLLTNRVAKINRVAFMLSPQRCRLTDLKVKTASLNAERLSLLREADHLVAEHMLRADLRKDIWQFPVVLVPVGIRDGESVALRPVSSTDGMTAQCPTIALSFFRELSESLMNLRGIDAVLLDVTNKPPATIEWE